MSGITWLPIGWSVKIETTDWKAFRWLSEWSELSLPSSSPLYSHSSEILRDASHGIFWRWKHCSPDGNRRCWPPSEVDKLVGGWGCMQWPACVTRGSLPLVSSQDLPFQVAETMGEYFKVWHVSIVMCDKVAGSAIEQVAANIGVFQILKILPPGANKRYWLPFLVLWRWLTGFEA